MSPATSVDRFSYAITERIPTAQYQARLARRARGSERFDQAWPLESICRCSALRRIEDALSGLLAGASSEDRHLALTLAADFGHVEIVRLLLDAGEDPNRYNPVGGHSHTTPLHQAAGEGTMK